MRYFKEQMLTRLFTILLLSFSLSNCGQRTDNSINKVMTIEKSFEAWLDQINKTEKVDSSIIAFNFGLFESNNGYTIYLIGSKEYDEENEDWATNVDFEPKDKYLHLEKVLIKTNNWEDVLSLSTKLISNYVSSPKYNVSILKDAQAITTGFDDGNLIKIK